MSKKQSPINPSKIKKEEPAQGKIEPPSVPKRDPKHKMIVGNKTRIKRYKVKIRHGKSLSSSTICPKLKF